MTEKGFRMPTEYSASTTIDAPPERVWALLTDAPAYPTWNTGVLELNGTVAAGERLSLRARISPKRAFKMTVSEFDAPRRMVWSSGMPLGLFAGARSFAVTAEGDGCRFETEERFTGPLANMICKKMPDLTESFEQWCADLKAAAEA